MYANSLWTSSRTRILVSIFCNIPVRRRSLPAVAIAGYLGLSGCGYVGEPLPPALNIPNAVADLGAIERGSKIVINFTIPERTTENLPLRRVSRIELRLWPSDGKPFELGRLLANSREVPVAADQAGAVTAETEAAPWLGRELFFIVRSYGPGRRPSGWSNIAVLRMVPPLPPIAASNITAEAVPEGVQLRWQYDSVPDLHFRIFRASNKEPDREQVATAAASGWIDHQTSYGTEYHYWLQAVRRAGENDAESEVAGPVSITPVDTFPPATPRGLNAVAGLTTIELSWDPNTEPDLAYYRVYRADAEGDFVRLADKESAPAYSDRQVASGKLYRYRVSSVDRLGNESRPSETVQATAP